MRRYQAHQQKKRRRRLLLMLPIVMVMIAAAAVLASGATFTATSANPGNVFTTGNLSHTNNKDGKAILWAEKMKPGDYTTGSVTIENDGDLPGTFSLGTSGLAETAGLGPDGGKLSEVLQLKIEQGTTNIYTGSITGVGTIDLGTWAAEETRTYDFTVTFPDGDGTGPKGADNKYKQASLSIQFDWLQVQ